MSRRFTTAALFATAAGALALAGPAHAADVTYTVSKTADDNATSCATPSSGACSLRGALAQASSEGNAATIILTTPGTYSLSQPLVVTGATGRITVAGRNPDVTTLSAAVGVSTRLIQIEGDRPLTLQRLTLSGGKASGDGGGVLVDSASTLTVALARLTGNAATGNGGAVSSNGGTVVADRSTFDGNTADSGAALAQFGGGETTLTNVTVARNTSVSGPAVFASTDADDEPGTVGVVAGTISGNVDQDSGAVAGLAAFGQDSAVTLSRTVVDQADVGCDGVDGGDIVDDGTNLDSGATCSDATSPLKATPAGLQSQLRYSTGTNSGGPPVLAPAPGSAAIDALPAVRCSVNRQDAREFGDNRPVDGNGDGRALCDVGAVEYASAARDFRSVTTTTDAASVAVDVTNGDAPVSLRIEYGATTDYGSATAAVGVAYAAGVQRATLGVGGLAPGTAYHFRVVASDGSGTFYGPDRLLTTKPAPMVAPVPVPATPAPAAFTQKLGKVAKLTLKRVAKKGYAVRVTCSLACTARVELKTTSKLAKRLKLKGTRVARGTGTGSAGKPRTVTLRLSRSLVKRLRRANVKRLTLIVKTTPTAGGKGATTRKTVTVKG